MGKGSRPRNLKRITNAMAIRIAANMLTSEQIPNPEAFKRIATVIKVVHAVKDVIPNQS